MTWRCLEAHQLLQLAVCDSHNMGPSNVGRQGFVSHVLNRFTIASVYIDFQLTWREAADASSGSTEQCCFSMLTKRFSSLHSNGMLKPNAFRVIARAQHSGNGAATPHEQQPWQQALLQQMQLAHSTPSAAYSSCEALEPVLDVIYDGLDDIFYSKGGFVIPKRERQIIDATGGSSSYGEVQAAGINQLLKYMSMDSSSIFVDLGCGRGRAVLQVAAHSPAQRVVGLELSESRLEQADMGLQQLQRHNVTLQSVEFRQADLSSCALTEGTHFYMCSTAFGASLCRSIAERLKNSPNFQVLVTSRQLPTQPYLYKLAEVPCEYSFNLDGRAYLYVKSLTDAPPAVLAKIWCRDGVCWLPGMSSLQYGIAVDEPLTAGDPSRFVQTTHAALDSSSACCPVAAAPSSFS